MSELLRAGPSFSTPFGDYDPPSSDEPSPKFLKVAIPSPLFSPSADFSKMSLFPRSSTDSPESEDSDEELALKTAQIKHLELICQQGFERFNAPTGRASPGEEMIVKISEGEKKRLRNTMAARKCRQKTKEKIEGLEEESYEKTLQELNTWMGQNEMKNQYRIGLLSQVEQCMRTLEAIKTQNPELGPTISHEAKEIVDTYTYQVKMKRKAIEEHFAHVSGTSY